MHLDLILVFFWFRLVLSQNLESTTDFLNQYEQLKKTTQDDGSIGAIMKCGEGDDRGKRICVPYFNCNRTSNTIIKNGESDGFGVIDIRFGKSPCDHHLDVCCQFPPDEDPVTHNPIVTTSERPSKGNFCGIRNPDGIDFKITGNMDNEAEYGEFPWVVAILKKNYNPLTDKAPSICGGALINPKVILTGAHCVYKRDPSEMVVRAGEWDTQTTKERLPYQERDVKEIIIHKDFKQQNLHNDIALLILERPYKKADNLGTICLPSQNQIIDSKNCFASGWGKNIFEEGQYQVILKKVELPIVSHQRCEEYLRKTRLSEHFILDESFICAGGEPGKDTCTGDGGSPLVCPDPNNPNRYVQAGIVAWGIGCGENRIPGVYADVSKFRSWVDEELQRLNIDTRPYYI